MSNFDVVIVGGGISGLSALHFLRRNKPGLSVKLYEADNRLGGTIGTDHVDGYSFDWGPNGFLDREPLTLKLCDELGLSGKLERANAKVTKRFILRRGALRQVPMSPPRFMASDILSLPGRLRVLLEPFAKAPDNGHDESIYDFVQRRIGREAADYLVQPMVSGIYGGVASRLSLKSCFPIMKEMESEHGSLFKAMLARSRRARAEGRKAGGPSGPGGWLTSFKGGLYPIIERFAEVYRDYIVTGKQVVSLAREGEGTTVVFADGSSQTARQVIVALPANIASGVVKGFSPALSHALGSISYAPISVICLGYRQTDVKHPLDGFGFLVPQKEDRRILGTIWTSSIFAGRAPSGYVQFRSMVGGDGDQESANLSDDELVGLVRADLREIVGAEGLPQAVKLYRFRHGIPQYLIGHSEVMRRIEQELRQIGNLHLTGNAYYGIGLNDCVKQSWRVADAI